MSTCLLIEDDEMFRAMIKREVRNIWEDTILAPETMEDLLDDLEHDGPFDLVLVDFSLWDGVRCTEPSLSEKIKGRLTQSSRLVCISGDERVVPEMEQAFELPVIFGGKRDMCKLRQTLAEL